MLPPRVPLIRCTDDLADPVEIKQSTDPTIEVELSAVREASQRSEATLSVPPGAMIAVPFGRDFPERHRDGQRLQQPIYHNCVSEMAASTTFHPPRRPDRMLSVISWSCRLLRHQDRMLGITG
jgi:hypothetical protein